MVLVTFRTVQSKLYKIELAPETTIKEAKERFVQEVGGGNPSSIKMIFKAKLLTDDTTIASLNLGEKDFIVVHAPKPSAKPAPPAQTPSPATAPAQPSQTPGQPPEAAPIPTPQGGNLPDVQPIPINQPTHPAQPAQPGNLPGFPGGIPAPGAPDMGAGAGAGGIPEGPEFQEGINSLVELGFPRTDCEAALRAAFGNVDRAAEYLYSGHIPETEEIQQQQNFEKSV